MLLYNKSLDPMHAFLRISAIVVSFNADRIEKDRLRIFDFILGNPSFIPCMSLGKDVQKQKNNFKKYESKYRKYDARALFECMAPIHEAVFFNLVHMGVLVEVERGNWYEIKSKNLPNGIKELIDSENSSISKDVMSFINKVLSEIDFLGPKGLKHRSGLMEYKYDAI